MDRLITQPTAALTRKMEGVALSAIIGPIIGAGVAVALPTLSAGCVEEVSGALVVTGAMVGQGAFSTLWGWLRRERA